MKFKKLLGKKKLLYAAHYKREMPRKRHVLHPQQKMALCPW